MSTLQPTMTLAPDRREQRDRHGELKKGLRASSIGNALEWFDWTVYAIFAPYLAKNLFNPADGMSALEQYALDRPDLVRRLCVNCRVSEPVL